MNTPRPASLTGLFALSLLLGFGTIARAQMEAGTLGARFLAINGFIENIKEGPISDGHGFELTGNLPVTSNLDAGVRYSRETFSSYDLKDNRIGAYVTGYMDMDTFKPYAELSVSRTSQSSTINRVTYKNSESIAAMAVGVEAPMTRTTAAFGQVAYNRYFDSDYDSYWTYKIGINTWVSPRAMVQASVAFFENDSVTFTIGIGFRL